MPSNSIALRLGGLPRFFFSVSIVMSPLFLFRRKPIFSDRCAVISGLGVSPTSIWYFRSLCGAKYNACYFCCAVAHISSLWDLHITQAFDAPSSNLELCDLISPPLWSAVIFAHAPAWCSQYHHLQNCKLAQRSYRAGSAAVWWKSPSIVITKIIMASLSIACEKTHWILDSLFLHNGEYLGGT